MKKLILIFSLIFAFSSSKFFAEDLSKDDYFIFYLNWASQEIVTPEIILDVCTEEDIYDNLSRENVMLSKDGWFYFTYFNPMILGRLS